MNFDRTTSAGYLINHLSRLFFEALRKQIEPLGIVPGQFPTLLALWEKDGQDQKGLVETLAIEQATLANTLKRMERDGLVFRTTHPTDNRAKVVFLTEKGRSLREAAQAKAVRVNALALGCLSEEEAEQYVALMQRVIEKFPDELS